MPINIKVTSQVKLSAINNKIKNVTEDVKKSINRAGPTIFRDALVSTISAHKGTKHLASKIHSLKAENREIKALHTGSGRSFRIGGDQKFVMRLLVTQRKFKPHEFFTLIVAAHGRRALSAKNRKGFQAFGIKMPVSQITGRSQKDIKRYIKYSKEQNLGNLVSVPTDRVAKVEPWYKWDEIAVDKAIDDMSKFIDRLNKKTGRKRLRK